MFDFYFKIVVASVANSPIKTVPRFQLRKSRASIHSSQQIVQKGTRLYSLPSTVKIIQRGKV